MKELVPKKTARFPPIIVPCLCALCLFQLSLQYAVFLVLLRPDDEESNSIGQSSVTVRGAAQSHKVRDKKPQRGHRFFQLNVTKDFQETIDAFLKSYSVHEHGEGSNRARWTESGKQCFLDDPHCLAIGQNPDVIDSVRELLKLPTYYPLYLWGLKLIVGYDGRQHFLHTDLEFNNSHCHSMDGATAWILLEHDCHPKSPLTLFSGSHKLRFTAQQEQDRTGCAKLKCDVLNMMDEVRENYKRDIPDLEVINGPNQIHNGVVWPTTAWHMTKDTCNRKSLVLQYTTSVDCAKHLRCNAGRSAAHAYPEYPEKYAFVPVGVPEEKLNYSSRNEELEFIHTQHSGNEDLHFVDSLHLPAAKIGALSTKQQDGEQEGNECLVIVENNSTVSNGPFC